jgi:hypothetical protein
VTKFRVLCFLAAFAASASAAACKIVPKPTTADRVVNADAIHVVDVLRIEADPEFSDSFATDARAIAVIRIVQTLKGRAESREMRVRTVPDDCGGLLWPGRWLVYLHAPSADSPLWRPEEGSFPITSESKGDLDQIKSLLNGKE